MREYWAKIERDKIIFFTREYLEGKNIYSKINRMRMNYRGYQRRVKLTEDQCQKLQESGIIILKHSFLALNGEWHWFTGYSNMDAFRFTSEMERIVDSNGYYEVKFTYSENNQIETKKSSLNLDKLDPKTTLFIVSCTYKKIWKTDPIAPDFVPAKYAYKGDGFIRFLKWANDEVERKGFFWIILSGKYGFIEPLHPITRYDINIGDPTQYPISDETLKNQVNQRRWWRDLSGKLIEVRLSDFHNLVCVNCNDTYLEKIQKCFSQAADIIKIDV